MTKLVSILESIREVLLKNQIKYPCKRVRVLLILVRNGGEYVRKAGV